MNTCATCRFWSKSDDDGRWDAEGELAVRDPVTAEPVNPQPFEIRRCRSPRVRFYERPEANGASLMDGSQYFALLITGPDFGCIAHESHLTLGLLANLPT